MKNIGLFIFLLFSSPIFALDESDADIIDRFSLLESKIRLHNDDWSSNYPKLGANGDRQAQSSDLDVTDWSNIKEEKWLDFSHWKKERALKDKTPQWKEVIRNRRNNEIMGRVLKCLGICSNYRGSEAASSKYMTVLREGDEFFTDENSYAWIVMTDGSLLRLSPKTSLTFNEINISKESNFLLVRLNEGHVYSESRLNGKFEKQNKSETDTGFYPLLVRKANRAFFAINDYQDLPKEYKLRYAIKENPGHESQYQQINDYLSETKITRSTKLFLYSPNTSVLAQNVNVDLMYTMNGKSYLYYNKHPNKFKSEDLRIQKISTFLRGHSNRTEGSIDEGKWYEVNNSGTQMSITNSYPKTLDAIKAFSSRVPSIQVAREIFLRKYSKFIINEELITDENMIVKYEYRLWDFDNINEMNQRLKYIIEYTRRVETTNLLNIGKLFKISDGKEINNDYFRMAMNKHYDYIKNLYSEKRKLLFEMNQTQYYMWLLRYGKN
jgi:hypothetical protein